MNTIRSLALLYLLVLLSPWLLAQTQEVKWKIALDSDWKWWEIHNTGLLIVQTSKSLYGIDPETEQVLWQRDDLPTKELKDFQFIADAPFIKIVKSITAVKVGGFIGKVSGGGTDDDREIILDAYQGITLFDSKGSDIKKVSDFYTLPSINKMLLVGTINKKPAGRLIDLSNGNSVWEIDLTGGKTLAGRILKEYVEGEQTLTLDPEVDKDGHIIIPLPSFKSIVKYDGSTGKILWEKEIGIIQNAYMNPKGTVLSVFVDEKGEPGKGFKEGLVKGLENVFKDWLAPAILIALNAETGEEVWRYNSGVFNFLINYEENMMLGNNGRLRLLDYETGQPKVEYSLDPGENIELYRFTEKGLLIASDKDGKAFLYLFANDGTKKWKSEGLAGEFYSIELSGKNVSLMTSRFLGVYSLNSGSPVLRENITFGTEKDPDTEQLVPARRILLPDFTSNALILYTKEKVYRIDLNLGEQKLILEKFKFKGDETEPFKLDIVEGGYLLSNNQNLLAFDGNGQILYQKYYIKPNRFARALVRFAKGFYNTIGAFFLYTYIWYDYYTYGPVSRAAVVAARPTYRVISAGYTVRYRLYNYVRPLNRTLQRQYALVNQIRFQLNPKTREAYNRILERKEKEAGFAEYKYIFSRNDDKTEGMYQIDIRTNKELAFLPFDDKTPEYEIDYVNGNLYFLSKKNEISVFELVQGQ